MSFQYTYVPIAEFIWEILDEAHSLYWQAYSETLLFIYGSYCSLLAILSNCHQVIGAIMLPSPGDDFKNI